MTVAFTQPEVVATRDSLASIARTAALQDPDWAPYADLIDVEFDGQAFRYVLTGDDAERIEAALDLEYGVNDRQGAGFLRRLPNG